MQRSVMHILRRNSPIIKRTAIRPNPTIQSRRPRSRILIVSNMTVCLLRKQQTALAAKKRQIIQIRVCNPHRLEERGRLVALVAAGAWEVVDIVAEGGFGVVGAPAIGALVTDRDGPFAGEAADDAVDFRGVGSVEHAADIVTHILAFACCDVDLLRGVPCSGGAFSWTLGSSQLYFLQRRYVCWTYTCGQVQQCISFELIKPIWLDLAWKP